MITQRRTSGVSLIEVLVVIVVLLVGIVSLIRLFPPGFLINKRQEEVTTASAMAQAELDRMTAGAANLMDAIVPVIAIASAGSPTGYIWQVLTLATPDDLSTIYTDASGLGVDPYYLSDANKRRRILGEQVRIPLPSPLGGGLRGSVYVLGTGPIYDVPSFNGNADSIFVSGAPLSRRNVPLGEDPAFFLNRPSQYAIDYQDGLIAFANDSVNDRRFIVNYSYYDAANQVQTIVDEIVLVAAGNDNWINLAVPAGRPLVSDSDTAARAFKRLGIADPWSFELLPPKSDPYEYKMLSPSVLDSSGRPFATMGALVFNPTGRDYTENTSNGRVPLTARIDYDVLDWHIIREDRPMPGSSPYNVQLALKGVKRIGDFEVNQEKYTGVWRSSDASAQQDLVVVNLTSGAVIPQTSVGGDNYTVDFKQGIVRFSDSFGASNSSGAFRILYKAHGDWALAVQKATASYRRRLNAALGYNEFYLGGGTDGGNATRLYLPISEAGFTVSVRELWYTDTAGKLKRVANETYRINQNRLQFEDLGGGPLSWIDLKEKHPDAAAWPLSEPVVPAFGVQGVSLRSRLIWNDGASVEQSAGNTARVRWRKVDLDTFLTRKPE